MINTNSLRYRVLSPCPCWCSTTLHVALEVPAITSIKGTFFYAELAQKLALNVISTGSQVMKVLATHVHADTPHHDCMAASSRH